MALWEILEKMIAPLPPSSGGRERPPVTPGRIVDTTLIAAPLSTKNKADKRDPEMHQSKKGNQSFAVGVQEAVIV